ncbi:MAG TPA: TldD/PmbA family protein [Trueperaceae bacterium]|nr:TldD/PmbA family protein [Trueperaceae bacterium]
MLNHDVYSSLLAQGKRAGADFAEVYVERWRRRGLRTINGAIEEATSSIQVGAGVRLFFGHDVVYGYTNDLTEPAMAELVASLATMKGAGGGGAGDGGNGAAGNGAPGRPDAAGRGGLDLRRHDSGPDIHAPAVPFESHDKHWRLARLREADQGARVSTEISQVEAHLLEWEQDVTVANSEGTLVDDRRVRTRLVVQAIARADGETQTGYYGPGLSVGLELLDLYQPTDVGRQAGEMALVNLHARKAPAGSMPVVVGNAFGGVIFHEALGHLLETTAVARKASVLADKLGEQIASEVVTYVDDGTTPHGWGSSRFDDEGAPTERTVLIEDGVLKSYMVDRWGSLLTGYRATGSGRRQDYTYAPTSRMRNTFVLNGDTPQQKLFEGIEHGLYAKVMGGGQVRPGSGEYNFAVREGYMIRNGEIAEPVRGAMLLGKGPDTIKKIVAVSDDLNTEPGMCGSKSGSIPTEVGQPHLLVSDIVVGGEA